MAKNHLKTIATPRTWAIKRKKTVWITKPKGGYKLENCMSINTLLKDFLKYAKTKKEVKRIITKKGILINGISIKKFKQSAGLMDMITIPSIKESYRIFLNGKGKLDLLKTDEKIKLCKITNKTRVKGKTQLNLFGGKNVLVGKDVFKVGDTVVFEFPENKIKDHIKFGEGSCCYLIGGNHIGETGVIKKIEGNKVLVKGKEEEFETLKKFVYIVGKEKPLIKLEK